MKVTKTSTQKPIQFPCLMESIHTGMIILASGLTANQSLLKGTVLDDPKPSKIGEYAGCWNPESFIPYQGKVTLENEF